MNIDNYTKSLEERVELQQSHISKLIKINEHILQASIDNRSPIHIQIRFRDNKNYIGELNLIIRDNYADKCCLLVDILDCCIKHQVKCNKLYDQIIIECYKNYKNNRKIIYAISIIPKKIPKSYVHINDSIVWEAFIQFKNSNKKVTFTFDEIINYYDIKSNPYGF